MDPCARNCCPGANAEAPPPRASAVDEAATSKPTKAASIVILVIAFLRHFVSPVAALVLPQFVGIMKNTRDGDLFKKAKRRAAQHVHQIDQGSAQART